MNKVYLVSSGEYSDYSINAAFSTRELAELYIESMGNPQRYSQEMMVEEYDLDANETHIREGFHPYRVKMDRNGNTLECRLDDWDSAVSGKVSLVSFGYYHGQPSPKKVLCASCVAKDEQHAVKIANEKRTQMIATGEWQPEEQLQTT